DVVVCGGGTAGFAAAVAAARMGARTAVIERFGACGGTMTVGGVTAPALFHAFGRQIIAGIGWELMTRLAAKGYAELPPAPYDLRHPQMAVELNAFRAEVEIDRMLEEAGAVARYHQSVVYAETENERIASVLVGTFEGLELVRGKVFLDCTGDAVLSRLSGAEVESSEELQPASLNSVFMNVSHETKDRRDWDRDFRKRVADGELDQHDVWGMAAGSLLTGKGRGRGAEYDRDYVINAGSNLNHVYPFDGANNESRTAGEIEGRRSIARVMDWLNGVPGYENAYVASCAPLVSARESCRVVGRAYITGEDYVAGVVPPDAVCYSFYPIDVHRGQDETQPLDNVFLEEGKVPGIPLGALEAKGFENLLTAGRIISGDRRAQSAYRVQATCMATGEAAGTAAALAVRKNTPVTGLDPAEIRETLAKNGAIVPGKDFENVGRGGQKNGL
ncbi:MAG: FAD-dependent oxidoreductase, partial [Clostridia bacterium]|nr:FAD-dependent oxidoreductase [Clostridia bacterium]